MFDVNQDIISFGELVRSQRIDCLKGLQFEIRHEFSSALFWGTSLQLLDAKSHNSFTTSALESCFSSQSGVKSAWSSQQHALAQDPFGDEVEKQSGTLNGTGFLHDVNKINELLRASSVHESTGVAELHRKNITGHGITIAILDSGLDYYHRALGGGFGAGYKVTYGRDLVGTEGQSELDPYNECRYHGTHVTGIAVGKDPLTKWVGVAPDAKVEHYRIAACEDDPVSMVLSRITNDGIVCVVAAGNNGLQGSFSADAPAAGMGVLSVTSSSVKRVIKSRPTARFHASNETFMFPWAPANSSHFPETIQLAVHASKNSSTGDACAPSSMGDISNVTLLVRRGGCKFPQKMQNIQRSGGRFMLIQDIEGSDLFDFDLNVPDILGTGAIPYNVGEKMREFLSQGQRITLSMDSNFTTTSYMGAAQNNTQINGIGPRSTWGPSGDFRFVPSLAAPGTGVMSAFPRSWGGFGVLSGTSMAAPYVAGCVALIKQVRPHLSAQEIVSLLVSTADPVHFNDGNKTYDFLAPVFQQGGGIINPLRALNNAVIPSAAFLSFNDTLSAEHQKQGSIAIRNTGSQPVRYQLGTSTAVTILAFTARENQTIASWTRLNESTIASKEFMETLRPNLTAALQFENGMSSLIVQPGESAEVKVTADLTPLMGSRNRCPLYGGYITLNSNAALQSNTSSTLRIPFGGLACSLQDIKTIKATSGPSWKGIPWVTSLGKTTMADSINPIAQLTSISSNVTFHLPGPSSISTNSSRTAGIVYPAVLLRLGLFTKQITIDVFPWSERSSIGLANGSFTRSSPAFSETLTQRPGGFNRVDSTYFPWTGQLANGTWVAAGSYFFRVCALKPWRGTMVTDAGRDCVDTVSFNLGYI
ncbi:serine endopeptidase [Venturia nashicola]|uniref:Serine endopeptidase n=1 Tax=Venturia nashicola TaxID=86259 RepID=A0A4Z1PCX6_9PEZI|nr:serine endopeptidase [Venturia nashicola]